MGRVWAETFVPIFTVQRNETLSNISIAFDSDLRVRFLGYCSSRIRGYEDRNDTLVLFKRPISK
jgi:hypothetical protein